MSEQRNILLAIVLSVAVLMLWDAWMARTRPPPPAAPPSAQIPPDRAPPPAQSPAPPPEAVPLRDFSPRPAALAAAPRLNLQTPRLTGSVNLQGARLDDLALPAYRASVDPDSAPILLFSPAGTAQAYFADFGWRAPDGAAPLPGPRALWRVEGPPPPALTPETPLRLIHESGGLVFRRQIALDADYMFTITQSVENRSGRTRRLAPHAAINRVGNLESSGYYLLHEGFIAALPEEGLIEIDYGDLQDAPPHDVAAQGGWAGLTDKYWAAALIPDPALSYAARFSERGGGDHSLYRLSLDGAAAAIAPGGSHRVTTRLFAGAKEVALIDRYEADGAIPQFDLLIDWGWFYFLTKPLFLALDFFFGLTGNFGVAILIVTILIKVFFFPLANRSYVALSALRKLQPEIEQIRERHKDDRVQASQEMIALYRREKVSPLPGCMPILLQVPVFFAIYKVLFVTIEMRHAPFFGWIADLSAPDPSSLLSLFGLLPFSTPEIVTIGVWPILMGATLFIQMRLNPPPPDPVQRAIFAWFPVILTLALARFPAGLVIYWTWSNLLSILQQTYIMKRQGVDIALFGNLAALFSTRPRRDRPRQ